MEDPNADLDCWPRPQLDILCTLPEGPVTHMEAVGDKLYVETVGGLYEILRDGTFIGVRKER